MLENFAVMELARQLTWSAERGRLYHYRTKDQIEVDAVIETPDGRVLAAEVKAAAPMDALWHVSPDSSQPAPSLQSACRADMQRSEHPGGRKCCHD